MKEEEIKKLKCELCEKENYLLIKVEMANDTFGSIRGICCQCFQGGNLEQRIFLKNKKFILEQIESTTERKDFWEKELKELET